MNAVFTFARAVTLNLFQGPFRLSSSGLAARWMLKQVQHDETKENTVTPAKAGVSGCSAMPPEMPAFAGMTNGWRMVL